MEVGSCILALIANDLYSSFRVVIKWPKIQQRKLNCKKQQSWSFDGRQKQDTQQKNKPRKKVLEHKKNEYCKNMQQMLMKTRRHHDTFATELRVIRWREKTAHRMMQEKKDVNFIRNEYKSQASKTSPNDERKSH